MTATETSPIQIADFEHLRALALDHENEFFLRLGPNGEARSSKGIRHYEDGDWDVRNDIDDSYSEYDDDDAFKQGEDFIMQAIEAGALYMYPRYTEAEKQAMFQQYLRETGQD